MVLEQRVYDTRMPNHELSPLRKTLGATYRIPIVGYLARLVVAFIKLPQLHTNLRQLERRSERLHDEAAAHFSTLDKHLPAIQNVVSTIGAAGHQLAQRRAQDERGGCIDAAVASAAPVNASVVICTNGRCGSLQLALQSLRAQRHRAFEVVVVCGPSLDGTRELLADWPEPIKVVHNAELNVSSSRNIGISASAGDVVAFLDDDAIPEAEWLEQIMGAYADPAVGAVGGLVFDHTGMEYAWRFGTTDRLGRAELKWTEPVTAFNFPYSYNFPHLLGANSTFRRAALLSIGGFDEEFEYHLDETDLQARILDRGWRIAQLNCAVVHHKVMASHLRTPARVLKSRFQLMKSKLYFGLVHRHGYHTVREVLEEFERYVQMHRSEVAWAVGEGLLDETTGASFESEVTRAVEVGMERGLSAVRRLAPLAQLAVPPPSFLPYVPARETEDRRTFCLLTREYPPGPVGGVGRYMHELATGLAGLGHQVHVIAMSSDISRVDYEDGVWVHRLVPQPADSPAHATANGPVPRAIWDACATRLREIERLLARKRIDCVYGGIWDSEGAAVLFDGRIPLVVGLQTPLALWLESNPEHHADPVFMAAIGRPLLALEKELLIGCAAVHAIGQAVMRDIEAKHEIDISSKATRVPLGLSDVSGAVRIAPPPAQPDVTCRVLFIGRLEARKGIDVLLGIAPDFLARHPHVQFDIVGNDRLVAGDGGSYRGAFERRALPEGVARRIIFHGEVEELRLRGFLADCDIFVAPSRYESFGLVFVEAMMFGKPVIGGRAGGVPEVVVDNETGLLVTPGDARSLATALETLVGDPALRARLGKAGRRRYEERFGAEGMVRDVAALMISTADAWVAHANAAE